jgi:hypothetical protein
MRKMRKTRKMRKMRKMGKTRKTRKMGKTRKMTLSPCVERIERGRGSESESENESERGRDIASCAVARENGKRTNGSGTAQ